VNASGGVDSPSRDPFAVSARIEGGKVQISVEPLLEECVLLESLPENFRISWLSESDNGQPDIIGGDRFGVVIGMPEQWTILPSRASKSVEHPYQYSITRELPYELPMDVIARLKFSISLSYIPFSMLSSSSRNLPTPIFKIW
jgi:hypothetical protein